MCGALCGDRRLSLGVGGHHWAPWRILEVRLGCVELHAGIGGFLWAWEGITGPPEHQGHEEKDRVPGARRKRQSTRGTKKKAEYQGHEERDRVPGARRKRQSTRGTKNRVRIFLSVETLRKNPTRFFQTEYQGHEKSSENFSKFFNR